MRRTRAAALRALQLHGSGMVRVGGAYYGFGEDKVGQDQTDTSFRAIPCYSSTDLATWTYQREALARQKSGDLGPHRVVERPEVLYNASTGRFVMYLHIDDPTYGEAKVGVATSTVPLTTDATRVSLAWHATWRIDTATGTWS